MPALTYVGWEAPCIYAAANTNAQEALSRPLALGRCSEAAVGAALPLQVFMSKPSKHSCQSFGVAVAFNMPGGSPNSPVEYAVARRGLLHRMRSASHEVVVTVCVPELGLFKLLELHFVSHQATNTAKALAKLVAFLGPISDELQLGSEVPVVFDNPFDEQLAIHDVQLHARFRVTIQLLVFGLRRSQKKDLLPVRVGIPDLNPLELCALPHDKGFHCTHVQRLHRVFDAKAILPSVLRNLVQKL
mmetsp:Transcript_99595/g.321103  ORF Transcript_99595/g.321103 Transcript_99595/m.321103 type:complete len:245 (-) Transcript_99595:964-1698(-)